MMRPNHGTRHTPRAVRTVGARKLIFAARAETDCCIVSQSTSSAYKIPSLAIASCARDAADYDPLFEIADKRLYGSGGSESRHRFRKIGSSRPKRLVTSP